MFERQQIEKLLTIHGTNPTAPDEEIRAVLISAQWNHNDIDAAIYVLRENPNMHNTHRDALHKVYRTDERLQPETIKALLGIDLEITSEELLLNRIRARGKVSVGQFLNIAFVSILLAVVFITFIMWVLKVGMFHQTMV